MQSAWTEYWKAGHFESLPEDRAAGRLGSLDSAWAKFFSGLSDGARLLDLATGGGDVIRRAFALGRNFTISGVDLADLSAVSATLQAPGIELIGNTDLSKLPFPDALFDGVTSQFGIEYADLAAATREAIRVLAPGGRGHFVLHHADGAITQGVANSLAADRTVFGDGIAFQLGRTVFELRQGPAPQAAIAKAEEGFRKAVAALQSRIRNERAFVPARNAVTFLAGLVKSPGLIPAAEALRRIGIVEGEIHTRTLRKKAQLDAAVDKKGMDNFAGLLASAGAVVDPPLELKYPMGKLMAWSLSFHK
jgi:SAM-dependent methyltransferase